jgi:uncharacterized protein (TIGR00255 family)
MESMTGYHYLEKTISGFSFSVEIKSLNSKFLELFINLPRSLRSEENGLNGLLRKYFARGKVEVTVDIFNWTESRPQSLNSELLKIYWHDLKKVHTELKIRDELKFESLLSLEGVTRKINAGISSASRKILHSAVEEAAVKALKMRKNEGKSIYKDIMLSVKQIETGTAKASKLSAAALADKKKSLMVKFKNICPDIDDSRIYSEIAMLADKLDINEEVVRLKDHLKKFMEISRQNDQTGRRLDFIAQEMFREINTIASKSNSSAISHLAVEMKNHIDKIREHCRNIA